MNIYLKPLLLFFLISSSTSHPRGFTDPNISQKQVGKLFYKITGPENVSEKVQNPSSTDNGLVTILGRFFEKNDIVASLMHLVTKVGERALEDEKIKLYGDKYIQEQTIREYTTNQRKWIDSGTAKAESAKEVQFDEPIPIPSGSFSVDSLPESIATESKLPPLNNEWKSTLFGPKGLLTEVFHFVNEKRKQGFDKAPQADLPPSSPEFDVKKVFDAILMKSGDGFDDPKIPELPFIGICNRLNCGDIYKAVDQFKKSEFFSNFQTALSLIQDPKGWDIIGEVLENPELIEQFAGKPENIGELLGKAGGSGKSKTSSNGHSMSVLPSDGDLGIDFTSELGPKKINKPEIAASIDGNDYYSAVEKEGPSPSVDYDYENIEETIPIVITTTTEASTKKTDPPLPELSFSVDEAVESVDSFPEYGSAVEIEESVPVDTKSGVRGKPPGSAMNRRFILPSSTPGTPTVPRGAPTFSKITPTPSRGALIFSKITPTPSRRAFTVLGSTPTPRRSTLPRGTPTPYRTTTTKRPSTTTKRNFRKDDDYYSMYYDN